MCVDSTAIPTQLTKIRIPVTESCELQSLSAKTIPGCRVFERKGDFVLHHNGIET